MQTSGLIVHNIGELVTLAPLAADRRVTSITGADLGVITNAWLAAKDGRVEATGTGPVPAPVAQRYAGCAALDAQRGTVLPGLVDSHSHPLFAGSRADEFCQRLAGSTYQEIAAAGGGILATVRATRQASDAVLLAGLSQRLARSLAHGITTLEVKSGYGLSVAEELRHITLLHAARSLTPQQLSITCLALHAASPEHPTLSAYVAHCARELLPAVVGMADAIDAFVEPGYYSVADVQPYIEAGKALGLSVRLHADEFSDGGAAAAAAAWGAASADHLQCAAADGVAAMARAGTTATLLPGTSLYTRLPFTSARRFADAGVAVALATDFNPGSCAVDNLAMLATVGAVQCGLRPAEAVAAVTYVPAHSLGLQRRKGALATGHDADFLLSPLPSLADWLADFGKTPPSGVWIAGRRCVG